MATLATFALAVLLWAASALLSSLGVSLAWSLWRGALRRLHPATRARTLTLLALAPCALATLAVALCLAPGLGAALEIARDHCTRHADHPHLCLAHPTAALTPPLLAVLLLAGGSLLVKAVRDGVRLRRMLAPIRGLEGLPATELEPGVRRIDSARPLSLTTGLLRPATYVSRGLVEALPESQLEVVLAHERAHRRRRDPTLRLLTGILSFPLWPATRRALLREAGLAAEQACDEEASRKVGDRLLVAETLLAVELLCAELGRAPAPAFGFGESSVRERIESLLAEPSGPAAPWLVWWAAGLTVALAAASSGPLHHEVEHLLAAFRLAH
jgi:Zn-dependent protease with chaperone function